MLLDTSSSSGDSLLALSGSSSVVSSGISSDSSLIDPRPMRSSGGSGPVYGTRADDVFDFASADKSYTVFAGDGFNSVFTGSGNDKIYSGFGNDIIEAGDGRNTISAGDGINLIYTGSGSDNISTGSGNDFIDAGAGRNIISAGEGKNRIITGSGNDLVNTGAGNDTVYSGDGNDTINVGDGNNVVNAGTGKDTVTFGSGNNKLVLEAGQGSVTVNGFDVATDKLRLGTSLEGKTLTFVVKGSDTKVLADGDLLAVLKGVNSASQSIVDGGVLYTYTATDLGSLSSNPNGSVNAASINDFGQVAGRYDTGATFTNQNATTGATQTNNIRQGFIWENGTQTALTSTGTKEGQSENGAADGATVTLLTPNVNTIGNRGNILGTGDEVRQPVPIATDRALVWQKNSSGEYELVVNDFGGIESYVFDTNNRNQVPGRNIDSAEHDTPIYYAEDGTVVKLPDLGGNGGTARGINRNGDIVGYVDSDGVLDATGATTNTAVIWKKDDNGEYQLTNLGTFGGQQATLRDINGAGQIIGSTTSVSGTTTTTSSPFLVSEDGTYTALGSLGGTTGSANGINEFGEVVGASQTASLTNHAYVWVGDQMIDLNTVLATPLTYQGSVVTLTSAVGINNFGDIVATGTYTYTNPTTGATATGTRSFLLNIA